MNINQIYQPSILHIIEPFYFAKDHRAF